MTLVWTDWEDDLSARNETSPYIDWLKTVTLDGSEEKDGISIAPLPLSAMAAALSGQSARPAPLPGFARPPEGATLASSPPIELTWIPEPDCAIVGVIDSAIALSHPRFRRIDGGTRFLSAWLQGGHWRNWAAVPFGRELFRSEIDRLMWRATTGGMVDEAAFDRSASLTQFDDPRGDRRLENNATHGTFVADLAGGFDLADASQDEGRRRLPLIAVGLPPRTSIGSSGNFLEFFAIHAVEYIIERADQIWSACGYGPDGGFPIIINLSYALQAGPKDGHMLIEQVIRAVDEASVALDRPVRVILPAGNDLMSEGTARFGVKDGGTEMTWRIKPEDHTPNYAELWSDQINGDGGNHPTHPLSCVLSPPLGPSGPATPGRHGQMTTLIDSDVPDTPVARIYCRKRDNSTATAQGEPPWHRMGYVLCTAPTLETDRLSGAPSGAWRMQVTAQYETAGFAHVQSDQNLTFGSNTGLLSYFEHPAFDPHDEAGRLIDAFDYPTDGSAPALTDTTPPIRRRGTLNTIASLPEARVIGSYRLTDGKPSHFSSAASPDAVGDGRAAPSALLPGEDGAARFGLLGAGSKSGSAATLQGTSFSTALATRAVALAMLDWIDAGKTGNAPGSENWFADHVANDEATAGWPGRTATEKAGLGRMSAPDTGTVPR